MAPPTIISAMLGLVRPGPGEGACDQPAATQHGDRVRDRQHLADLVQDQDYRDPVPLEALDALEQRLDARWRQHGRRLVKDQQPGVRDQRAGDLHPLLRLDRQVADAPARIDVEVEGGETRAAAPQQLAPAVEADAAACAELQRLRHGEGGREREALVDQLDAGRPRAGDTAEAQRAPVDIERAGIGPDETGRNAGEGRLAGAVLADHGVDGAARKSDRKRVERRDLAVCDANPAAVQRRRVRGGHAFRVGSLP